MIAHVVLFRPRPTLDPQSRANFAAAFTSALSDIPSVRRARVGRRVLAGRPYDAMMTEDLTHAAIIEFDDREGFQAYLDHPTHAGLAARFFDTFEAALIYDYEMSLDAATLL